MCGFAAVMDSGGRTACAVTGRASNAVSSTPVISRITSSCGAGLARPEGKGATCYVRH